MSNAMADIETLAQAAIDDGFQEQIKRLFTMLVDPANDGPHRFDHAMIGYRKAVADRAEFHKRIASAES